MNRRVIFNTPVVFHLFYAIAWLGLRLAGWKLKGRPPRARKFVIIAYPHTSNWDFPLGLSACIIYRIKAYWLGKDSLFKGPAGPIMRWLGGIPVDRSNAHEFVRQAIEAFEQSDELVIVVAPEGTRSRVEKWKTGFYHIATGAKVPIVPGYLDYPNKELGFLESFTPGGNIDEDILTIKAAYGTIQGKNADQSQ